MRKLLTWINRKIASGGLDRELYPALRLPVRFRTYEERDFDEVMTLYHVNAPDRFPPRGEGPFAEFLQQRQNGYMVAEIQGRVVASAGLERVGYGIYVLCYGLVHPHWQGKRIGSTMTLLRIAASAEGKPGLIQHAMIYSLPEAVPFYKRFGFVESGHWWTEDKKKYPMAILPYYYEMARYVGSILNWRGVKVEGGFSPHLNDRYAVKLVKYEKGEEEFKFEWKEEMAKGR